MGGSWTSLHIPCHYCARFLPDGVDVRHNSKGVWHTGSDLERTDYMSIMKFRAALTTVGRCRNSDREAR